MEATLVCLPPTRLYGHMLNPEDHILKQLSSQIQIIFVSLHLILFKIKQYCMLNTRHQTTALTAADV